MDNLIKTYDTLWKLVDLDPEEHKIKEIAKLFLQSMNEWPTKHQAQITDFVEDIKRYFGTPMTIEKLNTKNFNDQNANKDSITKSLCKYIIRWDGVRI